ncbi:MAG: ubiquinone biosynthesis protein [Betaproteobacteria bacterium]|nr:ubiquinone biosynthesis protein [Betaproteobacteria bacterium]
MLAGAVVGPVNHILRGESWALKRLQAFAGRTARFRLPPFDLSLTVTDTGELAAAQPEVSPEVTFSLTPGLLLRILVADERAFQEVQTAGDAAFATEIFYLSKNLRWDAEEDLSHLVGDILAHRIVQTGARIMGWRAQAMLSLARNLAEYWTEEQPLLAKGRQVEAFVKDVDTLRDDVERLEKRVERLTRTIENRN